MHAWRQSFHVGFGSSYYCTLYARASGTRWLILSTSIIPDLTVVFDYCVWYTGAGDGTVACG